MVFQRPNDSPRMQYLINRMCFNIEAIRFDGGIIEKDGWGWWSRGENFDWTGL